MSVSKTSVAVIVGSTALPSGVGVSALGMNRQQQTPCNINSDSSTKAKTNPRKFRRAGNEGKIILLPKTGCISTSPGSNYKTGPGSNYNKDFANSSPYLANNPDLEIKRPPAPTYAAPNGEVRRRGALPKLGPIKANHDLIRPGLKEGGTTNSTAVSGTRNDGTVSRASKITATQFRSVSAKTESCGKKKQDVMIDNILKDPAPSGRASKQRNPNETKVTFLRRTESRAMTTGFQQAVISNTRNFKVGPLCGAPAKRVALMKQKKADEKKKADDKAKMIPKILKIMEKPANPVEDPSGGERYEPQLAWDVDGQRERVDADRRKLASILSAEVGPKALVSSKEPVEDWFYSMSKKFDSASGFLADLKLQGKEGKKHECALTNDARNKVDAKIDAFGKETSRRVHILVTRNVEARIPNQVCPFVCAKRIVFNTGEEWEFRDAPEKPTAKSINTVRCNGWGQQIDQSVFGVASRYYDTGHSASRDYSFSATVQGHLKRPHDKWDVYVLKSSFASFWYHTEVAFTAAPTTSGVDAELDDLFPETRKAFVVWFGVGIGARTTQQDPGALSFADGSGSGIGTLKRITKVSSSGYPVTTKEILEAVQTMREYGFHDDPPNGTEYTWRENENSRRGEKKDSRVHYTPGPSLQGDTPKANCNVATEQLLKILFGQQHASGIMEILGVTNRVVSNSLQARIRDVDENPAKKAKIKNQ